MYSLMGLISSWTCLSCGASILIFSLPRSFLIVISHKNWLLEFRLSPSGCTSMLTLHLSSIILNFEFGSARISKSIYRFSNTSFASHHTPDRKSGSILYAKCYFVRETSIGIRKVSQVFQAALHGNRISNPSFAMSFRKLKACAKFDLPDALGSNNHIKLAQCYVQSFKALKILNFYAFERYGASAFVHLF